MFVSADESPETEVPPTLVTPTTPTAGIEKLATTPGGRSRTEREQRSGNTLYQELSFQDADALGEMDEGADITGIYTRAYYRVESLKVCFLAKLNRCTRHFRKHGTSWRICFIRYAYSLYTHSKNSYVYMYIFVRSFIFFKLTPSLTCICVSFASASYAGSCHTCNARDCMY